MSIPPLVCSTPPPPEQCEDDKDHEDFDITYNLSQEDDDSTEYNYGNYSSYNIYQASPENVEKEKWNVNLSNVSESKGDSKIEPEELLNGVNFLSTNELVSKESIQKFEESVIEDLNLIVNKDIVHSNEILSKEFETEVDVEVDCTDKQTRIQDEGGTIIPNKDETTDLSVNNKLTIPHENEILDDKNESIHVNNYETTTIRNEVQEISFVNDLAQPMTVQTEEISFTNGVSTILTESTVDQDAVIQIKDDPPADDDFGDFEDFQFSSTLDNCPVLAVNSENPWDSPEGKEAPEFGDFTANFDDVKETMPVDKEATPYETREFITNTSQKDDTDDFGDFDDFRSSDKTETVADMSEVISTPDVTLWNFNTPDNDLQIVDSINTVLTSIFANEISEPENELLGKLESCLSVTWGHLTDIEVRQPYMVNWNNSLGQKTLLKALCIDSRNILFGPKWSYNMPKYAVNLTAAPLQPQKQFVPSGSSSNDPAERAPNKEAGAWVDPFTPDGQEYTYAEALLLDLEHLMATLDQMAHKHSTLKISELLSHACNTENKSVPAEPAIRPTDLEVFESDPSTKLSKIYSSTINTQPLRHINLPDTHIFTPTDSETPRSKTIHYDSSPSGLIPQTVQESNKNRLENTPQLNENVENEYWDFQDFKGSNTVISPTNAITEKSNETVANPNPDRVITIADTTYQTQILQPIKIDPIIPTLNWPDPGEVKETFDDFSDFISNTSWNNEKENCAAITLDTQKDIHHLKSPKEATDNVDDEFETFQSAPASSSAVDFSSSSTVASQISLAENLTMKTIVNCDNPLDNMESKNTKKSNSVILENQSSSMSNNISAKQEFSFPQTNSGVQNFSTDILQPTSASSSGLSRHQHKSGQILQPLSLESYSQINWPNPGIDLQDLSRFNPINSLHSLKSDSSTGGNSKNASPAHNSSNFVTSQTSDDDIWGDFVSSAPKSQHPTPKKTTFADDDEWTDFVSSPSMKPQNGVNTISFNVHTNLSMQKSSGQNNFGPRNNQVPIDIPTLNYITPKSSNHGVYSEKHFQNL